LANVIQCVTLVFVVEAADWTNGKAHMFAKHDITPVEADEALSDPKAVRYDPDPKSKSGRSVRTIGYSNTAGSVVVVITVLDAGILWGVNGWRANASDTRDYYGEEQK
jgi:uncharacterized DUF497 family protein